jgi:hypothetical protein
MADIGVMRVRRIIRLEAGKLLCKDLQFREHRFL